MPLPAMSDTTVRLFRQTLERRSSTLLELSHFIHDHPETRFQESQSSHAIQKLLLESGFTLNAPVAGLETAFVAKFPTTAPSPVVALLTEFDALPGIGHACGHNIIAAMSTGAGLLLRDLWHDLDISGQIWVVGTPGEEGGGGKVIMAEHGVFEGVNAALMLHPGSQDTVAPVMRAREGIDVYFTGRASHAASAPDQGIDALQAAVAFLTLLNAMRQTLRSDANIHAIVMEGGTSPNIIVDRAHVRLQIRAMDHAYLDHLLQRVIRAAEGAAAALEAETAWARFVPSYQELQTHPGLASVLGQAFSVVGRPHQVSSKLGGSTDAGNLSHRMPTVHGSIAIGDAPGHSVAFAEAAQGPSGDRAVLDGALALALVAYTALAHPDMLAMSDRLDEEC